MDSDTRQEISLSIGNIEENQLHLKNPEIVSILTDFHDILNVKYFK